MSDRFLSRWSRLKRQGEAPPSAPPPASPAPAAEPVPAAPATEAAPSAAAAEAALPPVDSLDFAADFSAFMQKEVSEALRRTALRKLFSDPHFHFEQMDKLDIYIDDYSVSDPIPADVMQRLRQFEVFLKDEEAAAAAPDVPAKGPDEQADPAAAAPPSGKAAAPAAQSGPSGDSDAAPDPSPDPA
ncbi:DUF3306 domain-containing protein [Azoarcus sp. DN11]|uniref:DUF3306 domain-containing protein n=1 Tax=Azoarcus sp. DN11 TaxID=356837 RepID=UPI000EB1A77C|nr:DUF3306 domain-containing protein [Azoarcus sp. DN11]AYH41845.1 hypothetical protein CDA09_00325 [Azoarcus sp. DN11]